jgi:trimeric autotransporter adhesin
VEVTPDGKLLFLTGQFTSVGGGTRNGLASVTVSTGRVTTWAPNLYAGRVMTRDLDVSPDGTAVYVVSSGGDNPPSGDTAVKFPTSGSGNVAPLWVNRVMDTMEAVAVADDAVYIGGHLRGVDAGTKVRTRLAALDPATGTGLDWDPRASGFRGILDLTLAPAGLLVGSDGTHVGRAPSARFGLLPVGTP